MDISWQGQDIGSGATRRVVVDALMWHEKVATVVRARV